MFPNLLFNVKHFEMQINKARPIHICEVQAAKKQVVRDTKLKLTSKKPGIPTTNFTNLDENDIFHKSILKCKHTILIRQGIRQLDRVISYQWLKVEPGTPNFC